MNLNVKLLQTVQDQGFTEPTEIQKRAIPHILERQDLLATAETGSGKTAAFILPILNRLLEPRSRTGRGPAVLILAPTRELVDQIALTTRQLSKGTQIKFGTIIGGVPYYHQEQLLKKPLDILIATPGRLLDHMDKGRVDFSNIEFFVLDEADRMLDMGFRKDIEIVCESIPENHQTLLFSATLNPEIQKIAKQHLKDPVYLELAVKAKPHANISQQIYQVNDYKHKCELLFHILEDQKVWQAIVFTKTKRGAEKVADEIKGKRIACAHLHGDMKQGQRTRTIDRMHRGELRVLVATDVAGRGLDIKNLTHVINFDMASKMDDHTHRIGRTGRSGESGIAISFVDSTNWPLIHRIEKFFGQRLERCVISGLEPKHAETNSNSGPRKFNKNSNNNSNFHSKNGSNFKSKRGSNFNSKHKSNFNSNGKSHSRFGSKDDSNFNSKSNSRFGSKTNSRFGSKDDSNFNPKSNSRFGSKDDSNFSSKSNSRFGSKTNSRFGSKDDSNFNPKSNSRFGSKNNSRFGSKDNSSFNSKNNSNFQSQKDKDKNKLPNGKKRYENQRPKRTVQAVKTDLKELA